ncbi:epidermal growth factor-like protein 7 [Pomacea canaliculata]|uniref:epidermal growth factor-like protein 7 n=1 Tax=Pomacea canaliculata TaxID=400727 RepID=UPI000D734C0C|nr:epidermal growth factor-like protein 7 [Pomacea canaliculata]
MSRLWAVKVPRLALTWDCVSILLSLVMAASSSDLEMLQPGRHVCVQQQQSAQPVPFRQSYHRAVYRQTMHMCEGFRVCSRLALSYQTAYRTVFHMQIRTHLVQGCCPGWQKASPYETSCTQPVCSGDCHNGGTCVGPDTCQCADGWTGPLCQTDVDECAVENKCQQVCHNLPGSYECVCQDGFKIQDDRRSCRLCLSCLPEFQEMQGTISSLSNKVQELETEKDRLLTNLTSMARDYESAMDNMHAMQAATLNDAKTTTPLVGLDDSSAFMEPGMISLVHLASLSNQISMLEERMADCTCRDYDDSDRH